MDTSSRTTFRLFVKPSFWEGMARLFDFHDVLQTYRYDKTEKDADFNAIKSDWVAVGNDLKHAIHLYEREKNTPRKQ